MEKVERLEAEVEALKIVCMSLLSRVDRFTWREVRDLASASATRVVEWRQGQPWTDAQLTHVERVADLLTGSLPPTWHTPLLPPDLLEADALRRLLKAGWRQEDQ